jgi:hypothetical protein
VFPARPIAAGAPAPFPRRLGPLDVTYAFDGDTRSLDDLFAQSKGLGLVVLRDGVVVHERYGEGVGPESRFTSWSVAKTFVATLVGIAVTEGKIASLDDTAETYAPGFAGADYGKITIRNLLTMSAGVDFNEDYDAPDSDIRPLFFNAFILGRNPDVEVAKIRSDRAQGADFDYESPNTHVLAAVVSGAYGAPLADLVSEKLWAPLGMEGAASWSQNAPGPRGVALGYCCLNARSVDFARLGELWRSGGTWAGRPILDPAWVAEATAPRTPWLATATDVAGYGYQVWLPQGEGAGELWLRGVFGQHVWVDPARKVVIAFNSADPNWSERRFETLAAFRAIARAVTPAPEPSPVPPPDTTPDAAPEPPTAEVP